jgi:glutathione synthase/RimK-type ligase-like ATP-grasp enzyme
MVVKPLYLGFLDDPGDPQVIYTTVVSQDDMAEIATAAHAPSIYQERLDKRFDVRVTVVGEALFSAGIDASALPRNIPDWRFLPLSELRHFAFPLSPEMKVKCIELVRVLGLDFGAIDLAVDVNGRVHFLEINPNGQWVWIEKILGFPISAAIVDRLANTRAHSD